MADNVTTQNVLLATLPTATPIGSAECTFSGDTVQIGLGALVEVTGAEGSRTATLISPATTDKQDTGNTSLASIDTKLTNPLPVSGTVIAVTGGLTDTQLRATPVPVSGTVAITAAALPLPSNAAQETGGHLATIDTSTAATAAVDGTTAGAAVITDANGTLQQYLRGLVKLAITAGSWLVTAQGDTAAAAADGGNPVKIGGKAASAAPSAVTAGQRINGLFDLWGRLFTRSGSQAPVASTFTQIHVPNTNVQATKTQASAGSGKRNVCTGFTVTLCAGASAVTAAAPVVVSVIDGASGGGTYLWRSNINIPATPGAIASINRSGLWLVGSQATALTVEFSAAGGTNSYETVAFDGVIVEE